MGVPDEHSIFTLSLDPVANSVSPEGISM